MKKGRKKKNNLPILAVIVGGILILIFLVSLNGNNSLGDSNGILIEQTNNPENNIPRVSVEEAKQAYDNGEAIFVDVRSSDSYARRHIKGAISIPLNELVDKHQLLEPGSWIITYCT